MQFILSYLPLIAGIEIFAGINYHESSNNLENEYERFAWRKCASEQVLEYQRRLYDSIMAMDDTLYISDDVENYYRLICRSVKSSDKCLPRAKYKKSHGQKSGTCACVVQRLLEGYLV